MGKKDQNFDLNQETYFDGSAWGILGHIFLGMIMSIFAIFTLGFSLAWWIAKFTRWIKEHTVLNNRRLRFDGNGRQVWGTVVTNVILILITAGLYTWYARKRIIRWEVKHTSFEDYEEYFEDDPIEEVLVLQKETVIINEEVISQTSSTETFSSSTPRMETRVTVTQNHHSQHSSLIMPPRPTFTDEQVSDEPIVTETSSRVVYNETLASESDDRLSDLEDDNNSSERLGEVAKSSLRFGIASLILSIFLLSILGFAFALPAISFGRKTKDYKSGKAGLVLGILVVVGFVVLIIGAIVAAVLLIFVFPEVAQPFWDWLEQTFDFNNPFAAFL